MLSGSVGATNERLLWYLATQAGYLYTFIGMRNVRREAFAVNDGNGVGIGDALRHGAVPMVFEYLVVREAVQRAQTV